MGNFDRGGRGGFNKRDSGGGRSFDRGNRGSGGRDFGGRSSGGRTQMHDAVCSDCGKDCQVPFRPTGSKPIFCSNCFENQGSSSNSRSFSNNRSDRRGGSDRPQMHEAICDKCGDNCEVPFRPTDGKPIYCNNCFSKDGKGGSKGADYSKQFDMLSTKLDKIMKALNIPATSEKFVKEKSEKKEKKVKKDEISFDEPIVEVKKEKTKATPKKTKAKTKAKVAPKKAKVKKKK